MEEQRELAHRQAQIDAENERVAALRRAIDALKRDRKKARLARVRLSSPHAPLTYAEKEAICHKITSLPPEQLPGLLEIIQAAQPPSAGDDGEVEIDIEKLDDGTLLKVQGTMPHTSF